MQDNSRVTGNSTTTTLSGISGIASGGGVFVAHGGGTFIMQNNAAVYNNTAHATLMNNFAHGGGVYMGFNTTFVMKDNASVSDNTASISNSSNRAYGGGIFLAAGWGAIPGATFTMYGGSIDNNIAIGGAPGGTIFGNARGGGVHVEPAAGVAQATFTMYGGTISNNTVRGNSIAWGGGVNGITTMHGGTISGNTAYAHNTTSSVVVEARGGGVNGALTMHGGAISGNHVRGGTTSGTGIEVTSHGGGMHGVLTMHGGTISGNTVSASAGNISNNLTLRGGGVSVLSPIAFTKTGGTINGNDGGSPNTVIGSGAQGHAVFEFGLNARWRNATAGPAMNSDTPGFWEN